MKKTPKPDDVGPALPAMSLRDYFAAQILYAVCRCDGIDYRDDGDPEYGKQFRERRDMFAAACYRYADAMLRAREVK